MMKNSYEYKEGDFQHVFFIILQKGKKTEPGTDNAFRNVDADVVA